MSETTTTIEGTLSIQDYDDYVWNPPKGRLDLGDSFVAVSKDKNAYIEKIYFFKVVRDNLYQLKSFQIEWSNGEKKSVGAGSDRGQDKLFFEGEQVKSMALHADDYKFYALTLSTTREPDVQLFGNPRGVAAEQAVGSGRLAGFHGRVQGGEILGMGAVFWK